MNGIKFLDKIYSDLHLSKEVIHTKKGASHRFIEINRYMDRLNKVHNDALKNNKLDLIKRYYYNRYVIDIDDIEDRYSLEEKNNIIEEQRKSLDTWIDYLCSDASNYPIWAKYWVFNGMLKIGTYNREQDIYMRRNSKTISPFIEMDPEAVSKSIAFITDYVDKGLIKEESLKILIENGQFNKLYTTIFKNVKKEKLNKSDSKDGKWIKYNMNNIEDSYKLAKSIQRKNTHWCTAEESTARAQICGGYGGGGYYKAGDFYVYYTKSDLNEYSIPRVAIRLEGRDTITEIRGVLDATQNLEPGFEDIIKEKILTLPQNESTKKFITACDDSKRVSKIEDKIKSNKEITKDDLKFLYSTNRDVVLFGWGDNPIISKLKKEIKIPDEMKNDKELILSLASKDEYTYRYISDELKNDKDFIKEMVILNNRIFIHINEDLRHDKNFIFDILTKTNIYDFIPSEYRNNLEFAKEASIINPNIYIDLNNDLKKNRDIILTCSKGVCSVLPYTDTKDELRSNKEFVLNEINKDYKNFIYMSDALRKDNDYLFEVIKNNGKTFKYLPIELQNNRKYILEAIRSNPIGLKASMKKYSKDVDLIKEVLSDKKSDYILDYLDDEIKKELVSKKMEKIL